jgi:hypothetical protein
VFGMHSSEKNAVHMQNFQLAELLCRHVLDKFYIGDLRPSAAEGVGVVRYKSQNAEEEFYSTLRRRIEKFFRGNEVCSCHFPPASLPDIESNMYGTMQDR